MQQLAVRKTAIDGLLMIDLELHQDARGWFKENWQRAKMTALGLPDFNPVQNNVSFNTQRGATRGIHAEPWDKLISVACGRVFGAWVDLRGGSPTFGTVVTSEVGPETAVFIPRGVGNAYQSLENGTVYSYMVNEHWSENRRQSYTYVNLADPALGISWPIPLDRAELSAADRAHPPLSETHPLFPKSVLVMGADGQLGQELMAQYPDAIGLTLTDLDLTDSDQMDAFDWHGVGTVINAAAYTAVDLAETPEGRRECWAVNVTGLAKLVEICRKNNICLVHFSSDYVFDGETPVHTESEPFSPLGVYGQTKAAGDILVGTLANHYILRTSWLIGSESSFVRTMMRLAAQGASPDVVNDQFGRLTFTPDLAAAALHLLAVQAPFGVYNASNSGPVTTWHEVARQVFEQCGRDPNDVRAVTTAEYLAGRAGAAPRPQHSVFDLRKLNATGFRPRPWKAAADDYPASLQEPRNAH